MNVLQETFTPSEGKVDQSSLPVPIFDENPQLVDFYYIAWQKAWERRYYHKGALVSPYMSEGTKSNNIWIWDTCFMAHFCRYAANMFPGIQSLENFYRAMYDGEDMDLRVHHPDNPPLFAWTEYQYFKLTGDYDRLQRVVLDKQYLQKHYEWLENVDCGTTLPCANIHVLWKKLEKGYMWSGISSGLDNTPRGRDAYNFILWLDAISQQGLSALYIAKLGESLDCPDIYEKWMQKYEAKKKLLNEYYWCNEDGYYYDIYISNLSSCKVMTPASFWPVLAEMSSPEQVERMIAFIKNPELLGGNIPLTSVARNDKDFDREGKYFRGSVWLPYSYMVVKALEKYGYYELATEISQKTLNHMLKTYSEFEPNSIWECYSPTEHKPGTRPNDNPKFCRPDFCGWSALGPISLLIENILGFYDIDAAKQRIKWRLANKKRHGIKNLQFGDNNVDIIYKNHTITVTAKKSLTLEINDKPYSCNEGKTIIENADIIS